ncbi:hypothetical protein LXA43DRAFT_1067178 [Ganoderma leucocontextum]|nr:hypothetical protein LXA43DRAFT_1067178 [Ganoderma leucocontextum]
MSMSPISHIAHPCDENGHFLAPGTAAPLKDDGVDWWPFDNRPHFEFVQWNFEMAETSAENLNTLLRILAAAKVLETGDPTATAMFQNADEMLKMIEALPFGDLPWTTFYVKYTGPNPLHRTEQMARSSDFLNSWDYALYEEYTLEQSQQFCNLMSGRWASKQADLIAANPQLHGAMLTPVVLSAKAEHRFRSCHGSTWPDLEKSL